MRKHNEGYTLVLVMVAILILSTLTAVMLGAIERNLNAHKHGVQIMQDKYQAQGEIEKVLAAFDACIATGKPVQLPEVDTNILTYTYDNERNELHLTSTCETVTIDCTILITVSMDEIEANQLNHSSTYTIKSYQISTGGADE